LTRRGFVKALYSVRSWIEITPVEGGRERENKRKTRGKFKKIEHKDEDKTFILLIYKGEI
jgi:hypothetical protein